MKQTTLLFSLWVSLITTSAFGLGGDLVNNGGGLAEKNVLYAYGKLDTYIRACLESDICKINESQKQILIKILEGLAHEGGAQKQIVFESEKKAPGTFMIDGHVRIARTGDVVGSSIFFNVDMLYTQDTKGHIEAITVAEAVATLVHEMGHHYGKFTHEELDLLGIGVSLYLERKLITTPMIPWESDISATVYNPTNPTAYPELLLLIGNDIVDASELYRQTVKCQVLKLPIPIFPIPDIPLIEEAPLASNLYNVHWEKIREREGALDIVINGNISNTCRLRSQGKIRNNDFKLSLKFTVHKKNEAWVIKSSSLEMKQVSSPWYKFIKLSF